MFLAGICVISTLIAINGFANSSIKTLQKSGIISLLILIMAGAVWAQALARISGRGNIGRLDALAGGTYKIGASDRILGRIVVVFVHDNGELTACELVGSETNLTLSVGASYVVQEGGLREQLIPVK